ncbi:hypothetical protein NQ317_002799 [Molorchus minor]|uniref:Uncharacterized protein n=1 Tax=Molorchus minor TaxID=1323400 RepID=A0ABQ9J730_9CUCU|nr:hypothetical protein NQ317_002799 [Molorchus minor]
MPNSFESYVQEVGRAGRDGLTAHCHVFMDSQLYYPKDIDNDNKINFVAKTVMKMNSEDICANSIDRHAIRKLLQKVLFRALVKENVRNMEVAFSIEQTVRALDVPEENISTLLCYLELHEKRSRLERQPRNAPLAMALAMHKEKNKDDPNVLEFPVIDVAAAMGWESVNNQPQTFTN